MDMAGRIDETLRSLLNVMVYVVQERIKIRYETQVLTNAVLKADNEECGQYLTCRWAPLEILSMATMS